MMEKHAESALLWLMFVTMADRVQFSVHAKVYAAAMGGMMFKIMNAVLPLKRKDVNMNSTVHLMQFANVQMKVIIGLHLSSPLLLLFPLVLI